LKENLRDKNKNWKRKIS